jgi:hypothetical protein
LHFPSHLAKFALLPVCGTLAAVHKSQPVNV